MVYIYLCKDHQQQKIKMEHHSDIAENRKSLPNVLKIKINKLTREAAKKPTAILKELQK